MRYTTLLLLFCSFLSSSCSNSVTGPNSSQNLLANSTFQRNGTPSLEGWVVPDTSAVHFSTDVPQGGSGSSIVMHAAWFAPWPSNSIFTTVLPQAGSHRYTLSVLAKDTGVGGNALVYLNRPGTANSSLLATLHIDSGATWMYYSQTDTLTAASSDTLFVVVNGGGTEIVSGTTYFNTCKFELLK